MESTEAPAEGAAGAAAGVKVEAVDASQPQSQQHEAQQQSGAGRAKAKQKTPEQRAVLEKAFAGALPPDHRLLCTAPSASNVTHREPLHVLDKHPACHRVHFGDTQPRCTLLAAMRRQSRESDATTSSQACIA